jgi:hypothetical protein
MRRIGMSAVLILASLALLRVGVRSEPKEIYIWADVSVSATGSVEDVKVVIPTLSKEIAAPIENTISTWTFAPGIEDGQKVPRTTSVSAVLRLITQPSGASRIEAERLEEGPRILRPSHDPCLESMSGAFPLLTFTVTAEGRAVAISNSDPESEIKRCAIKVISGTLFKPDTVNGKPVSTKVSRRVRFR